MVSVFLTRFYQWFTNISGESDLQLQNQNEEINKMGKMKKHIYDESNGLHYTLEGDYYIPDMKLPEENRSIRRYGRLHRDYLKE